MPVFGLLRLSWFGLVTAVLGGFLLHRELIQPDLQPALSEDFSSSAAPATEEESRVAWDSTDTEEND